MSKPATIKVFTSDLMIFGNQRINHDGRLSILVSENIGLSRIVLRSILSISGHEIIAEDWLDNQWCFYTDYDWDKFEKLTKQED